MMDGEDIIIVKIFSCSCIKGVFKYSAEVAPGFIPFVSYQTPQTFKQYYC